MNRGLIMCLLCFVAISFCAAQESFTYVDFLQSVSLNRNPEYQEQRKRAAKELNPYGAGADILSSLSNIPSVIKTALDAMGGGELHLMDGLDLKTSADGKTMNIVFNNMTISVTCAVHTYRMLSGVVNGDDWARQSE